MNSRIYKGWVEHRRIAPRENRFRYRMFMLYVDLAELPHLFDGIPFWSARRPALAWFKRSDYLGPAQLPLDQAVRDLVAAKSGRRPSGPIRLLTHLRYFGYCLNPVSFYYCFSPAGDVLETIVAEITNTPWNERHQYVLPIESSGARLKHLEFDKSFHVSPFMAMDPALSLVLQRAVGTAFREHAEFAQRRAHIRRDAGAAPRRAQPGFAALGAGRLSIHDLESAVRDLLASIQAVPEAHALVRTSSYPDAQGACLIWRRW